MTTKPGFFRSRGFTLVELLTVMAIIAVLATLLMSVLGSAKKRSRQAYCTSNLRQISLAFEMYFDDFQTRPPRFDPMVRSKYLAQPAVLLCLEDKTGNWGGLVNGATPPTGPIGITPEFRAAEPAPEPGVPRSYLHPWGWDDQAWKRLMDLGSIAGIAACQLHGLGKPDPVLPSMRDYEGLLLRAQRDGAVVRRQIFWGPSGLSTADPGSGFVNVQPTSGLDTASGLYPWELYVDDLPPP